MNYVTLESFRKSASLGDLAVDDLATTAIEAAEEAIEAFCSRRFWQDASNVDRFYTAEHAAWLPVDDLVSAGTILTDEDGDGTYETTWASTDFLLAPYNAAADGRPYTAIEANATATRVFPDVRRGVKVTGKFGWPAVPDRVEQATIIQATRFLKRARSATFGIEAVTIDGVPIRLRSKLDPDVEMMLAPLRRMVVV